MTISIIGSGNIAWHFARFFYAHGHPIQTIYNRTATRGRELADAVHAQYKDTYDTLTTGEVDLLILAVKDDALEEVIAKIAPHPSTIVVHTSGATPMQVLDKFARYGVIYPLQSLSKDVATRIEEIPFAIEGSDEPTRDMLLATMRGLAPKSFACDSAQRLALHIGAVFVNNFVNALYQVADELLSAHGLDFELLCPILLETAKKVQNNAPKDVQTGPAVRNDIKTINRHLDFLSDNPSAQELYQQLTSFLVKDLNKP